MARQKVEWQEVDTDKLPASVKSAYDKFIKAYDDMDVAKEDFQKKAKDHVINKLKPGPIKEGKVPSFNYTGKVLLIAFTDPKTAKDRELFSF